MEELEPFRQELMASNLTTPEGFALSVAAKLFTIAGAVSVYGLGVSVGYRLIHLDDAKNEINS